MKKDTEYEAVVANLKEANMPVIDVTEAVMNRIHAAQSPESAHRAKKMPIWTRPVWAAAIALFFLGTVGVSAAAVLPIDWNGIKASIYDDGGEWARVDSFKELIFGPAPTYKKTIEDALKEPNNKKKTLTLEEAQKEYPFTILRPAGTDHSPTRSIGALMNITIENGESTSVTGYNAVFHDFYEQDKDWIIVTQSLDGPATDYLQGKTNGMSKTYSGDWENVNVSEQTLAMFHKDSKQNRLIVDFKTEDKKVISLSLIGTVPKEDLIKLAEAYIAH